jgi:hypothetical protein
LSFVETGIVLTVCVAFAGNVVRFRTIGGRSEIVKNWQTTPENGEEKIQKKPIVVLRDTGCKILKK